MYNISMKEVKSIRENIKKEFPSKDGWKFSVTTQSTDTAQDSCVTIKLAIKKAPAGFDFGSGTINHYWIQNHYNGKEKAALLKMVDILNQFQDEAYEDSEYGGPSYYIDMASHIEG